MSPWEKLLERPHSRGHFVQIYADDAALAKNVGVYLWEGLRQGDGVMVVATPEHQDLFARHLDSLGADLASLLSSRQLFFLDAQQTLNRFMAGGKPDWAQFEGAIHRAMRQVRPAEGSEGLRAYGEMVGLLWNNRQFAAATRLEQLWNRLLERASFSLYCAYGIDVFGKEFNAADLAGVLCTHTHLVPAQSNGDLEAAFNRSLDEILGSEAEGIRVLIKADRQPGWAVMPAAEAMVLWLRKNLPGQADRIVAQARLHYQALIQPDRSPLIQAAVALSTI